MKLIFSGKILEDSKTLESYSIKPDSFLVVVKQAPSKPPTVRLFPSHPSPYSAHPFRHLLLRRVHQAIRLHLLGEVQNEIVRGTDVDLFSASSQPAAAVQPAPSASSQQQQPSQAASASGNAPAAGQDSFLSPENREKALKELTDMGFERRQAELALRASFYHVERAAEYLITVS